MGLVMKVVLIAKVKEVTRSRMVIRVVISLV
jgi:hypothetical protein